MKNTAAKLLTTAILLIWSGITFANQLSLNIFVSEPDEINVTSPIIMGPTEMMVMCAQGTRSAAVRLADEIEATGLKLKYVFLSHPHLDHSQGATILLERFPEAKFIATPKVAALQKLRMEGDDERAESRFGDNAAVPSTPVESFDGDTLYIDGMEIQLIKDLIGDPGIGHPDEPHTALYIPSLHALLPSDIVYFDAHMMMGGSSKESRKLWVEQMEGWLAQDLKVVVPGHMPKSSLPELTAEGALQHSIDYVKTYDRVLAESETSDEVIQRMKAYYPGVQHESALYLGTFINFKEIHRLMFNPTVEKIASYIPGFILDRVNYWMFDKAREKANLPE